MDPCCHDNKQRTALHFAASQGNELIGTYVTEGQIQGMGVVGGKLFRLLKVQLLACVKIINSTTSAAEFCE